MCRVFTDERDCTECGKRGKGVFLVSDSDPSDEPLAAIVNVRSGAVLVWREEGLWFCPAHTRFNKAKRRKGTS